MVEVPLCLPCEDSRLRLTVPPLRGLRRLIPTDYISNEPSPLGPVHRVTQKAVLGMTSSVLL